MNITEAEIFFKKYGGHGFHMFREEQHQYDAYQRLRISQDVEERWRQEMIQEMFEHFFECPDEVWHMHSCVIEIIQATKTQLEENCAKLLELMEKMDTLDKRQKILLIENMAGRTATQTDGGCHMICVHTSLGARMNDIMQRLMDFECGSDDDSERRGWENIRERYLCAVNSYEVAYNQFKKVDGCI